MSATPTNSQNTELRFSADARNASLEHIVAGENRLWRLALIVLVALALGLAVISWREITSGSWQLQALPIGLVVLVVLFGVYALSRSRQIAQLKGLVQGLEHGAAAPPAAAQVESLFEMVRRSQQGYRDLIDTFDDLLFSLSADGEILAANRSFSDLVGRPFSELVGKQLDEFLDMADGAGRAAAQKSLPKFLERRHWSGVLRVRLKHDASKRYFHCTIHALVRDHQDLGLCVLAKDITRDRENETRFTELFETLQEGVYLAGADGRFENVNPALARMLGYVHRDDVLNRPLSDFLANPEQWQAQERELLNSDAVQNHEVTVRRGDGSTITCLHAAALIRDAAGRVRRHQGTLVDITERRQIEKRLHREQEFARRLVESFPDLVIAADREGRYTFVSPRSRELLGFTPEEMVGTLAGERIDPHDRKEVRALFDGILSGECSNGTVEYFTERKDGEMRLFRANASPLFDSPGQIDGVIASARDITEAKRMEQQLIQAERLAAMGQMIAGVAHELNNPLTAVLGVTELLRDSAQDASARRQLDLAHRQAHRAAQIVQSLLTFSRPPQPRKACVHLSDLVQRSLQLHEHSLRANCIGVDFVPKPDLPAVLGDGSQLTQVFLNLIANAEQAIREVRESGTLRIRLATAGDCVMATFQDDGVGIRREILPRLFDPFFTTKRPGRGTGLGLSICLAILREHNGQIEAQPLADGGSVFTVSLPIARGTAMFLIDSPAAISHAATAPAYSGRLSGCSVLVVEDEESIRELVRDGLSVRGVKVELAANGEQALLAIGQHRFDAVLCDLNLRAETKALSGRALYRHVMNQALNRADAASNGHKPSFIFMTGEPIEATALEHLIGPGTRVLQKPFPISELVSTLSDVLFSVPSSAQGRPGTES